MKLTKKIKLGNNDYYIVVDVEYKKHPNGFAVLTLKNFNDNYWDGGDCSLLIEKIEKNYTLDKTRKQSINNQFMADIIYIYERMPFISGIKEIYISKGDNVIYSESYISKSEIEDYIKEFNVSIHHNPKFKLMNERTWKV